MKVCKACGKIHNYHGDYCWKHHNQIKQFGKVLDNNPRTCNDDNEIRIKDGYAEIDTYDKWGNCNYTFKVDIQKVPIISKYKWSAKTSKKCPNLVYLCRRTKEGKIILYHRFILDFPIESVDHINRDTTDNRLCNLRVASQSLQTLNQNLKSNNSTGIKGVIYIDRSKHKRKSGYRAEIKVGTKHYYSMIFSTIYEASYCRYLFTQLYKDVVIPDTDMSWVDNITESQKESINKYFRNRFKNRV